LAGSIHGPRVTAVAEPGVPCRVVGRRGRPDKKVVNLLASGGPGRASLPAEGTEP